MTATSIDISSATAAAISSEPVTGTGDRDESSVRQASRGRPELPRGHQPVVLARQQDHRLGDSGEFGDELCAGPAHLTSSR